jgi:hypothetical protein
LTTLCAAVTTGFRSWACACAGMAVITKIATTNFMFMNPAMCDHAFTETGGMLPKFFFQPPLPHTQKYKLKKISPSRSSIVA